VTRIRWWAVFLVDVALCSVAAAAAGVIFGATALVEDVRFAWRRRTW
jgi:hypothetical protein